MKTKILNGICIVLVVAMVIMLIIYKIHGSAVFDKTYEDGVKQVDINTIMLQGSGVEVNFSDVILSDVKETRKLIVAEQTGKVSTNLTDRIIQYFDVDWLKKTQKVTYEGKGYFVVGLDDLTKDDVVDDKANKVLTIKIGHAYLEDIVIDPNNIIIDEVKEGLLARGDIQLTVRDYNVIEKELRTRLSAKFNTAENGQAADEKALEMVKQVYEPIIKAIDKQYTVEVTFR